MQSLLSHQLRRLRLRQLPNPNRASGSIRKRRYSVMSPASRWQQVRSLLEEALEQRDGDRSAFLDRACDGDVALREELESLLRYHASANQLSEAADALMVNFAGSLADRPEAQAEIAGQQIGHYQLIRELGRGGMGTV